MLEEPVFAARPCFKNFEMFLNVFKIVFEDILAHFKSSTFDPLSTLRIRYNGQPAADTGEVLH